MNPNSVWLAEREAQMDYDPDEFWTPYDGVLDGIAKRAEEDAVSAVHNGVEVPNPYKRKDYKKHWERKYTQSKRNITNAIQKLEQAS